MANKIGKCYQLCFDIESVSLNTLFDKLTPIAEVLLQNNDVYVWLNYESTLNQLKRRLKSAGVTDVYCRPIEYESIEDHKDFLSMWYIEHYGDYQKKVLEEQEQDKLKEMLANINKAKELLAEQQSTQQAAQVEEKQIIK